MAFAGPAVIGVEKCRYMGSKVAGHFSSRHAWPSGRRRPSNCWAGWNGCEAGDSAVADELLRHVSDRLHRLTRQMLKGHPAVRRWAQTDDVLQGALLRLLRAVQNVHPSSMREFFGLATQQIRRELIDLARHFYGPHGVGANRAIARTRCQIVPARRRQAGTLPVGRASWRNGANFEREDRRAF